MSHANENAASMAFIPIPFGWLLVYMGIGIVRWVRLGFGS